MLKLSDHMGGTIRCEFRAAFRGRADRPVLEALSFCMREEFGDTYSDPRVYDVDALMEMAAQNRLITAAAIREDGEPMAVISLKECPPFEGMGDLSMHVVRRRFRGFGLGTPLVQYIMDLPEAEALTSVVSHSATHHAIAQHESFRVGLRPCGALYSQHINDLLKHSFDKVGVKQTFLVAARAKGKTHAGRLYLPKEHRSFVADCYRRMGAGCEIAEGTAALSGDTRLQVWQDELHQSLTGMVDRCGVDLERRTVELLEHWSGRCPLETATFFLNCTDPAAPAGCRVLRRLGFRFAGLHPLCRGAEYLILHHPMGVEVPFDQMCVDESYRNVFQYLRAHYDD